MPTYTTNYNLTKPIPEENYDVGVVNWNSDTIDTTLFAKVDKVGADGINFDVVSPMVITNAGDVAYDTVNGTFSMKLNANVTLQAGQELQYYGKALDTITNGDIVQYAGSQGDHITFKKAVKADVIANPSIIIGIATENIATNGFGHITNWGKVNDVSTNGFAINDLLYFDPVNGGFTNIEPTAPLPKIKVCSVLKAETGSSSNGIYGVRIEHWGDLKNISDVHIVTPSTGNSLVYQTNRWENKTLTATDVGAEPTITKNTAFNKNYGTTATDVKMNGTQGVGSVDAIARIDHVHPVDTSRASATHTHAESDITNLTTDLASKATTVEYTGTITTTWVGSSAPYTQDVTISGILATDDPTIAPVYSATNATAILERTAWGLIGKAITSANTITFTCFETKPTTAINFFVKVVR